MLVGVEEGLAEGIEEGFLEGVVVEGVNRVLKHTKVDTTERGVKTGGIITTEASIHISNVMIIDDDGKATRLGARKDEKGKNVRISRRSGKDIK